MVAASGRKHCSKSLYVCRNPVVYEWVEVHSRCWKGFAEVEGEGTIDGIACSGWWQASAPTRENCRLKNQLGVVLCDGFLGQSYYMIGCGVAYMQSLNLELSPTYIRFHYTLTTVILFSL